MSLKKKILSGEHKFFAKGNLLFSTNKKKEKYLYLSDRVIRKTLVKNPNLRVNTDTVSLLENATILKYERAVRRFKI